MSREKDDHLDKCGCYFCEGYHEAVDAILALRAPRSKRIKAEHRKIERETRIEFKRLIKKLMED